MSKKLFRFIIIFFIIVLGAGFYVLLKSNKEGTTAGQTIVSTTRNIFPFGGNDTNTSSNQNTQTQTQDNTPTQTEEVAPYKKLRKLTQAPVSGFVEINRESPVLLETGQAQNQTETFLRYVDKATGNIFEIDPMGGVAKRITNTTIPNSEEVFFADKGETVVYRYTNTENQIETYLAKIGTPDINGVSQISGTYLPKNISSLSVSIDGKSLFYIYPSGGGVVGVKSGTDGKSVAQVFSSSFGEWLSQWVNDRTIILTTKASAFASGFSYTLDTTTKSFNKILGGVTGLTTNTSSTLNNSLISSSGGSGLNLFLYTQTTQDTTSLGMRTLPEKCVWFKENIKSICAVPKNTGSLDLPDAWYQGLVSWNDSVWIIDTGARVSTLTADLSKESGEQVDLINPVLSGNEKTLYFMNRYDYTLWSLDI